MNRTILHSDMNCFYASVEMLHHPEHEGKPLAVGGDPEKRHGIILTANYPAKRRGVKTGMALWQARQLCPELIIVPPRMDLYLRFSRLAGEIYREYTDLREPFGIDECWLDCTASVSLLGDGEKIAEEIRKRIRYELGVTVSIGVSWNKIFAKFGSDYKKPDAVTVISPENYRNRVWPLPAGDLLCVGSQTEKKLARMGILTVGDLAQTDSKLLEKRLGKMGFILHCFANGWDETPVSREECHAPIKSIGNSTTAPRDLENLQDVRIVLIALCESVAARLRENGFRCRVVEITVRDNELFHFTRQQTLDEPSDITTEIFHAAEQLFLQNYDWSRPIRSLGVRGTGLVLADMPIQLNLFSDPEKREKMEKADRAVDDIRRRYGYYSVQRAYVFQDRILSRLDAKSEHTVHPQGYFHG